MSACIKLAFRSSITSLLGEVALSKLTKLLREVAPTGTSSDQLIVHEYNSSSKLLVSNSLAVSEFPGESRSNEAAVVSWFRSKLEVGVSWIITFATPAHAYSSRKLSLRTLYSCARVALVSCSAYERTTYMLIVMLSVRNSLLVSTTLILCAYFLGRIVSARSGMCNMFGAFDEAYNSTNFSLNHSPDASLIVHVYLWLSRQTLGTGVSPFE